jgi:hypothetical protein
MSLRYTTSLRIAFVWVALALSGVAASDVVEDLLEQASSADVAQTGGLPEVENPVENALIPSDGGIQSPDGALHGTVHRASFPLLLSSPTWPVAEATGRGDPSLPIFVSRQCSVSAPPLRI